MQTGQTGQLWDRRAQRTEYYGDVRVLSPGRGGTIHARATNLSEAGVFVASDTLCEIGSHVVCDLPLASERLTVRGRVAWVRPERAERGMGIEFVDLDGDVAATLREVVGPTRVLAERIKVRFEGMPEAVRAEALRTDSGICLRTALPFLRLNSPVEFVFADDSAALPQHGWLEDVTLRASPDSPVPRLQVRVATPEQDVIEAELDDAFAGLELEPPPLPEDHELVAGQIEAMALDVGSGVASDSCLPSVVVEPALVDGRTDIVSAPLVVETPMVEAVPVPLLRVKSRPTPRRPELTEQLLCDPAARSHWDLGEPITGPLPGMGLPGMDPLGEDEDFWERSSPPRRRAWLWSAALAMAALAIASALYTGFFARVGDEATRWAHAIEAVWSGAPSEPSVPAPAAPTSIAVAERRTNTAVKPESVKPESVKPEAVKPETVKPEAVKPETAKVARAPISRDRPAARRRGSRHVDLQATSTGGVLRIPIRGSLRGKRSYRLSGPDGIVVRLPHARARLREGIYPLAQSGFRVLWVRPDAAGVRLRVLFQRPTPHCRLAIERREVSVRCQSGAKLGLVR